MPRDVDIILFGATGFTGRLVAEHLARRAPPGRWAIAGRSRDKLEALGLGVPIVVADAMDAAAMAALAQETRVVCTTVGPFARYGSALVAACAEVGTHYCDLTAEVHWMRAMIDQHHARAVASGARIVHAAGFDSVPSDVGVLLAQAEHARRHGRPAARVTGYFGQARGGVSGGTIASGLLMAEASADRAVRSLFANPYALDPDPSAARPSAPDERGPGWDPELRVFTLPFVMATSNTRVVRRGHALAGFPYGEGFVYREVMSLPGTARGLALTAGLTPALAAMGFALKRPALRKLLARVLPAPGEGPSAEARARGMWQARFVAGTGPDRVVVRIGDDHDPGYGSTARMLGESALCLAYDPLTSPGGVTTPVTAMGHALVARLAALGFTLDPARS